MGCKRTEEEVVIRILELLLFNKLKMFFTKLMEKSNLDYSRLSRRYLPDLIELGYIKRPYITKIKNRKCGLKSHNTYEITNEGIKYYINYMVKKQLSLI